MDHRNSTDGREEQSQRALRDSDVFDDDYALDLDEEEFAPFNPDGFRPPDPPNGMTSDGQDHDRNDIMRMQNNTARPADTELRRVATRNSIVKAPYGQDPTSQPPIPEAPIQGPSMRATPLQHREFTTSTASFATMTNSDNPFADGPSHPYGMYPQHTIARHSGVTNTSQRQSQSSILPQRPAHPYAMYSQNVVDDEPVVPQVQATIPIGFPGVTPQTSTGYQRHIGPYGEEQDIVGPDGHTEQLPPYSRHPEEGPTKASMAAEASASTILSVPAPFVQPIDTAPDDVSPASPESPVSPLSPAPPLAAVAPAILPQQRPETQTGGTAPRPATTSEAASLLTSTDGDMSEKLEKAESIKKKKKLRNKKIWGLVPVPCVIVLVVLLLILALVLGAALGSLLTKSKSKGDKDDDNDRDTKLDKPQSQIISSTLFGATPLATPASLAPLPTGQFSLPLGAPQEANPGCLTQGNQYPAWSCQMSFAPLVLSLSMGASPNASLSAFATPDGSVQYGLQSPVIPTSPLQLVTDLDFKAYGPAWHFSSKYDKIVVLSTDDFTAGASLNKRDGPPFRHRFQIDAGDTPWFCYWNQTYIEGYVYAQGNSTAAAMGAFPSFDPDKPFAPKSAFPTDFSTASAPTAASATPASSSTPSPSSRSRRDAFPAPFARLPLYPRIVKIEERRIPNAPQPYCRKMQLLDNGSLVPVIGGNGNPVQVYLQEQNPNMADFAYPPSALRVAPAKREGGKVLRGRGDPSNGCHCQWMFA